VDFYLKINLYVKDGMLLWYLFLQELNSSQSSLHDGGFFNRLEDDVHRVLEREKRRVQLTDYSETDNGTSHEHNQACKTAVILK